MTDRDKQPLPTTAIPEWIVIGADGTTGGTATAEDRQLAERGGVLLAQDPQFVALPHPVLRRVEVNTGVDASKSGRLCLRYDVEGETPQEFWPHWGKADKISWASGQISVARLP